MHEVSNMYDTTNKKHTATDKAILARAELPDTSVHVLRIRHRIFHEYYSSYLYK